MEQPFKRTIGDVVSGRATTRSDSDSPFQRTIDEVVGDLKNEKKTCTLLIGAGVSSKAEIPLAGGFVEIIKNRFPKAYERAGVKDYPHLMAELPPSDRRKLIAPYIDQAKVNWAHICIALLMEKNFVDRVLTVNFDPLVIKACALLGFFPAVYDFAASQLFKSSDVPGQAVFYLHGQRTGFAWKNTTKEVKSQSKLLGPVFDDAGKNRVWIVVGYSGDCDPVFTHLAKVPAFDNNLYWVCFKDADPPPHVRKHLLIEEKFAFYVKGYDADDFFATLAQQLDCFPPGFISNPFKYLYKLLEMVTPYSFPGQNSDLKVTAQKPIMDAIERFEKTQTAEKAMGHLVSRDYDAVIKLEPEYEKNPSPELANVLSWAHTMQGIAIYDKAMLQAGGAADALFEQACKKYETALAINPQRYEALYNWGVALYNQAKTRTGELSDQLYIEAIKKFRAAISINPKDHETCYNLGLALYDRAKLKAGKEADRLATLAGQQYQRALALKPDFYDALNNFGNVLLDQAKRRERREADRLYAQAFDKYAAAVKINPDLQEALYNWGLALYNQAGTKKGQQADKLFVQACEKYEAALKIKPDYLDALNNWGVALSDQACTKKGKAADKLFAQACEKYQAALKLKPDYYDALDSWGITLTYQAQKKKGEEADRLYNELAKKFEAVLKINPHYYFSLESWGTALAQQAATKAGAQADKLFKAAYEKYRKALKLNPRYQEALNSWSNALSAQARMKTGPEHQRLLKLSDEKSEAAAKLNQSSS